MKLRVFLTTIISLLLLAAVVAAGLNAIFTINVVNAEFSVASAEGEREAAEIKEKLDRLVGKSTTFLDEEEVSSIIAAYPCMKADRIAKHYPSAIEVSVSERNETFAVLTERGYAVLDEDGTYLYNKDSLINRKGGENVLLTGFSFSLAQGERLEDEKFSTVLSMYGVFLDVLHEARANVISIAYHAGLVSDTFLIQMREGIRIEIVSPSDMAEEKARAALTDETYGYLARSDGERLSGCITVVGAEGKILVDYDVSRN